MKKYFKLFLFIFTFFYYTNCYADTNKLSIINYSNPTLIKDNVGYKIKIYKYKNDGTETSLNGKFTSYSNFYIENELQNSSYYKYYNIKNSIDIGEKIYIDVFFDNTYNINQNLELENDSKTYKDLRLIFNYGYSSLKSDVNITGYNSISYYLIDEDNNSYGPFSLFDDEIKDTNVGINGNNKVFIERHKIISDNLLNNSNLINKNIKGIRFIPFDNYYKIDNDFRLYDIYVNAYDDYYSVNKEYINISNQDLAIRHEIVDNMTRNATIKWNIAKNSNNQDMILNFYNQFNYNLIQYSSNDNNYYYGIPYVNNMDSTLYSFISKTSKNNNSYDYNLATKYKDDIEASNGTIINKGDNINCLNGTCNLYVYEENSTTDSCPNTTSTSTDCKNADRSINLSDNPYVKNKAGYLFGMDCSSSTFSSIGQEIPYIFSMSMADRYYDSSEVELLGNLKISYNAVENKLRENNILGDSEIFNTTLFQRLYAPYMRTIYGSSKIFNAYGLLIPGDILDHPGHVRMVTGYPHIVCNDNTETDRYTINFCDNHGGIDGERSYAIVTEINGDKFGTKSDSFSFVYDENNWKINLDQKYTDLTSLSDYKSKLSEFNINHTYSFNDLYGYSTTTYDYKKCTLEKLGTSDCNGNNADYRGMYLPFTYKAYKIADNNQIEKPNANILSPSTYSDLVAGIIKGNIMANYIIEGIKIVVDDNTIYKYPNITKTYSLYYDLDEEIKDAIEKNNNDILKIYIKIGPNFEEVSSKLDADSEGYIKVYEARNNLPIKKDNILLFNVNDIVENITKLIGTTNVFVKDGETELTNNTSLKTGNTLSISDQNYKIAISGDVNKDGKVTISDVSKIYRKAKGSLELDELETIAADKNNNGTINISDVSSVYRMTKSN